MIDTVESTAALRGAHAPRIRGAQAPAANHSRLEIPFTRRLQPHFGVVHQHSQGRIRECPRGHAFRNTKTAGSRPCASNPSRSQWISSAAPASERNRAPVRSTALISPPVFRAEQPEPCPWSRDRHGNRIQRSRHPPVPAAALANTQHQKPPAFVQAPRTAVSQYVAIPYPEPG